MCVSPVVVFNTSYGEVLFQFEVHDTLVEYVFVRSFFFPPFFLFKGLNREHHLFKAGFHTTHTHWNTPAHTLKSRDIFLLGNLSINQCDFKHIPQATRLT